VGGPSPVLVGGLLAVVVVVYVVYLLCCYRRARPNEALIVSGVGRQRVVVGGGAFAFPFVHKVQRLSLEAASSEVVAELTAADRRVCVVGELQVRVGDTEESILAAARCLPGRTGPEMAVAASQVVEQHLRSAAGTMSADAMAREPAQLAQRVREEARADLAGLGLQATAFSIRDVRAAGSG